MTTSIDADRLGGLLEIWAARWSCGRRWRCSASPITASWATSTVSLVALAAMVAVCLTATVVIIDRETVPRR